MKKGLSRLAWLIAALSFASGANANPQPTTNYIANLKNLSVIPVPSKDTQGRVPTIDVFLSEDSQLELEANDDYHSSVFKVNVRLSPDEKYWIVVSHLNCIQETSLTIHGFVSFDSPNCNREALRGFSPDMVGNIEYKTQADSSLWFSSVEEYSRSLDENLK